MSLVAYSAFSVAALAAVLAHADSLAAARVLSSKIKVLVCVNFFATLLIVLFHGVRQSIFGALRAPEREHLYDHLLNFILFKIVFVGAVVLDPDLRELLVWTGWFALIGALQLLCIIARERFDYMAFSHTPTISKHVKIITMLSIIIFADILFMYGCISVFWKAGWSTIVLLCSECFFLLVDGSHALAKYSLHLADLRGAGSWESRSASIMLMDFVSDMCSLCLRLAHYAHVWFLHGISFTFIDAMLFISVRTSFFKLRQRIERYRNYIRATRSVGQSFPDASADELASLDDDCAICREPLSAAKKLPCGHFFHLDCLRSWFEHHTTCPICRARVTLRDPSAPDGPGVAADAAAENGTEEAAEDVAAAQPDLAREEARDAAVPREATDVTEEDIDYVCEALPHVSRSAAAADLALTRSVDDTVMRFMDGTAPLAPPGNMDRVVAPTNVATPRPTSPPVTPRTRRANHNDATSPTLRQPQATAAGGRQPTRLRSPSPLGRHSSQSGEDVDQYGGTSPETPSPLPQLETPPSRDEMRRAALEAAERRMAFGTSPPASPRT